MLKNGMTITMLLRLVGVTLLLLGLAWATHVCAEHGGDEDGGVSSPIPPLDDGNRIPEEMPSISVMVTQTTPLRMTEWSTTLDVPKARGHAFFPGATVLLEARIFIHVYAVATLQIENLGDFPIGAEFGVRVRCAASIPGVTATDAPIRISPTIVDYADLSHYDEYLDFDGDSGKTSNMAVAEEDAVRIINDTTKLQQLVDCQAGEQNQQVEGEDATPANMTLFATCNALPFVTGGQDLRLLTATAARLHVQVVYKFADPDVITNVDVVDGYFTNRLNSGPFFCEGAGFPGYHNGSSSSTGGIGGISSGISGGSSTAITSSGMGDSSSGVGGNSSTAITSSGAGDSSSTAITSSGMGDSSSTIMSSSGVGGSSSSALGSTMTVRGSSGESGIQDSSSSFGHLTGTQSSSGVTVSSSSTSVAAESSTTWHGSSADGGSSGVDDPTLSSSSSTGTTTASLSSSSGIGKVDGVLGSASSTGPHGDTFTCSDVAHRISHKCVEESSGELSSLCRAQLDECPWCASPLTAIRLQYIGPTLDPVIGGVSITVESARASTIFSNIQLERGMLLVHNGSSFTVDIRNSGQDLGRVLRVFVEPVFLSNTEAEIAWEAYAKRVDHVSLRSKHARDVCSSGSFSSLVDSIAVDCKHSPLQLNTAAPLLHPKGSVSMLWAVADFAELEEGLNSIRQNQINARFVTTYTHFGGIEIGVSRMLVHFESLYGDTSFDQVVSITAVPQVPGYVGSRYVLGETEFAAGMGAHAGSIFVSRVEVLVSNGYDVKWCEPMIQVGEQGSVLASLPEVEYVYPTLSNSSRYLKAIYMRYTGELCAVENANSSDIMYGDKDTDKEKDRDKRWTCRDAFNAVDHGNDCDKNKDSMSSGSSYQYGGNMDEGHDPSSKVRIFGKEKGQFLFPELGAAHANENSDVRGCDYVNVCADACGIADFGLGYGVGVSSGMGLYVVAGKNHLKKDVVLRVVGGCNVVQEVRLRVNDIYVGLRVGAFRVEHFFYAYEKRM